MRQVRRDELVDYATWAEEALPMERPVILAMKKRRRVHVGPKLTFLFENADTVRYQVQEMMRVERMVKESAIQHELDTYNELLGTDRAPSAARSSSRSRTRSSASAYFGSGSGCPPTGT